MKIKVRVKTRARLPKVEKTKEGELQVSVKALPVKGAANLATRRALADYFHVSQGRVRILTGRTSKYKIVEILGL